VRVSSTNRETKGEIKMKCMVFVKATKDSENGTMPGPGLLAAMGKYNEELIKAGIMQGGGGLKPTSQGRRVRFSGAERSVISGPFAPTEEQIAGYWIWEVKSMEIEIRPEFEAADFAG